MRELTPGWQLEVDVSPEWLFFRLRGDGQSLPNEVPLAEHVWAVAVGNDIRRCVFELDGSALLTSALIGQLILLHKRARLEGGVFRLCGLSKSNYRVLEIMRLGERFPNYATREDAVLGRRPT